MPAPNDGLSRTDAAILGLIDERIRYFWTMVDMSPGRGPRGDCWEWLGSKTPRGYGKMGFKGVVVLAHRVSFTCLCGGLPPPEKPCVLHTCDWPPCVRPNHLFAGTLAENTLDMHAKGRAYSGSRGRRAPRPVNPDAVTEQIKAALRLDPFIRSTDLATRVGCSVSLVSRTRHERTQKSRRKEGESRPKTKAERILEIIGSDPSLSPTAIARIVGCTKTHVCCTKKASGYTRRR